jgi:Family of unknown function (DUF6807)
MRTLNVPASLLIAVFLASVTRAGALTVTVDAGDVARWEAPVTVQLAVPQQLSADDAETLAKRDTLTVAGSGGASGGGKPVPAQINLVREGGKLVAANLRFVVDALKAGEKRQYVFDPSAKALRSDNFWFKDEGDHRDLFLGDRPIWRHAYLKYDPNDHFNTYKHFHHVYGMHDEGFITSGPKTLANPKQIRYPHHRGIFMGFNRTKSDSGTNDFWHCPKASLRHQSFDASAQFVGPAAARSVSTANWCNNDGKTIVVERRQVTTWNVGDGADLMDFDITLTSNDGTVELNGDPQHAGFQFRAHNDVDKTHATYIRPAGAVNKGGDVWADTAWCVNQFKIKDHPYAVVHMDDPQNPGTKEGKTVYSTRNYGRFGSFAPVTLKPGQPLHYHYRILVLDATTHGQTSVEHFDALYSAFVNPVKATVAGG